MLHSVHVSQEKGVAGPVWSLAAIIMPRIQIPVTSTVSAKTEPLQAGGCRYESATLSTLTIPRVKPSDPAKGIIRSALTGAIDRVQTNDPAVRLGDAHGVHRLRTTTRRLRGELHAFRDLVDPIWRTSIEADLKWLATALGGVRDLDVLDERLRTAAARLHWTKAGNDPEVTPDVALEPLFESIRDRHTDASVTLHDALRSDRYSGLVEGIARSLEAVSDHLTVGAEAPCREVLPPLVRASWKHLRRGGRALSPDDPHDAFHDVRKRSKRARYTAELIAPALGRKITKEARRFIRLTTRVQDVLGEHQDAVVAIDEIIRVRNAHPENALFVRAVELLLEDQQEASESARASFFVVWKKLDRKNVRRWMNPSSG